MPTGQYVIDFSWRSFLIELKTVQQFDGGDRRQLAEFAAAALGNEMKLVYMFLSKPTRATVEAISEVGGSAFYIFE